MFISFSEAGAVNHKEQIEIIIEELSVSELRVRDCGDYIMVDFEEATSLLFEPGNPMLPSLTKVFSFPLGTTINDINVEYDIHKINLSKKIKPSRYPSNDLDEKSLIHYEHNRNQLVYTSTKLYPVKPFMCETHVGLKNGERALYINVRIIPQYSPANDILYVPLDTIFFKVSYTPANECLRSNNEVDMLIISPREFVSKLQPLIEHKNNIGIKTVIDTTDKIYASYSGRDAAEEIKLRIRDAIEEWGITYVLLVGGRKGQRFTWYVPERKSNCHTFFEDYGYSTDLYYSDIYKLVNGELVFEDWDSNGNGIFAEWSWQPDGDYDYIDYCPDVYLGRLPCRYGFEVDVVVNKIIAYESNGCDPSWFKRFIAVGNDILVPNPHGDRSGIPEGDMMCDIAAEYLESSGFETVKLYPSDGSLTNPTDFINTFNEGAGMMLLTAHASPALLKAHPINKTYGYDVFYSLDHMEEIKNAEKLPIIINCGCHCSQFNVTMINFLFEMIKSGGYKRYIGSSQYYMHNWVPECVDWWWVRLADGGAIATIGNTHYGKMELGDTPYYFLNDLNPWIALRFFDLYANQQIGILGEIHGQSITDYVNIVGGVNGGVRYPPLQRNQVEEWILFGDPSLQIGGYEGV